MIDINIEMEYYIGCLVLHALGDTIGYKNGEWEFKKNYSRINNETCLELVYEFINLGGITNISLKDWKVSDDTVFSLATYEILCKNKIKVFDEKIVSSISENMINSLEIAKQLHIGRTTEKYLVKNKENNTYIAPYDKNAGGNGGAMRTLSLGLCFFGEENREILIKTSIAISKITHNNAIGYLGGLVSALMVAFAIEKIKIEKWGFKILDILEENKKNICNIENEDENNDYDMFMKFWRLYLELRFKDGKLISDKSMTNLVLRNKFFNDNFNISKNPLNIGNNGYSSVIMAYDGVMSSYGSFEKIIYYTMLHSGDTDTTGAIAGGIFGAYYGIKKLKSSKNLLKDLEYKKDLLTFSKNLYSLYYKN